MAHGVLLPFGNSKWCQYVKTSKKGVTFLFTIANVCFNFFSLKHGLLAFCKIWFKRLLLDSIICGIILYLLLFILFSSSDVMILASAQIQMLRAATDKRRSHPILSQYYLLDSRGLCMTSRISVILYDTFLLGVGVLNLNCRLVITQSLSICMLQFKFKTPIRHSSVSFVLSLCCVFLCACFFSLSFISVILSVLPAVLRGE